MISPPHFWQSDDWMHFQLAVGNASFWRENGEAKALVIERKPHFIKFWKRPYWEIPRGPIGKEEDFSPLLFSVAKKAKEQGIAFVRVYPPYFENEKSKERWEGMLKNLPFPQKPAPEIFPEHTLCIDLTKSEDEILEDMKQKGRYNIRLAEKKGVEIFEEKNIENFWTLLQRTAKRDGFTTNKKAVYQSMIESFGENGILLTATDEEGDVLASSIFVKSGDMAVYYYGASSPEKRFLMAPYLLQWRGIQWAKEKGATVYDFLGIAPEEDENHRLKTVSDFKLKFGGERIEYLKGIDIITA